MGASVRQLDRSGWRADALARLDALKGQQAAWKGLQDARQSHPLAKALDEVSEASMDATLRGEYRSKVVDFGNGHREACVWFHQPDPERSLERAIERDMPTPDELREVDREGNIKRAVRRAKQQVRYACKSMMVNSLWTLTYKENVQDRDLVLRHLDQFRRRVGAVLGEWKYIAVLEKQERGAYHIHLATHALPTRLVRGGVKVKSWDVMRSIWHRVVGTVDGKPGGNFDEAKRKRRNGPHSKPIRGAGAIASYIAGYVAKDMEETELNRKRYSVTRGVEMPKVLRDAWGAERCMRELITAAYAAVGDRITRAWFDPVSQVFFVESDDSVPVG